MNHTTKVSNTEMSPYFEVENNKTHKATAFQKVKEKIMGNASFMMIMSKEVGTFTSVAFYHPLRTIAVNIGAGQKFFGEGPKISLKPKDLYRGLCAGTVGAHQLFMMSVVERGLREKFGGKDPSVATRVFFGVIAGITTVPVLTPFEMMTVQRQMKNDVFAISKEVGPKVFFRGVTPMFFRQMGLGAGMFTLPVIMQDKLKKMFPEGFEKNKKAFTMATAFMAGCFSATITQYPEIARAIMQMDAKSETYKTALTAFKEAKGVLFSSKWNKILGTRVAVIGVATMVMNTIPEFFQNIFFNKEKR